MKRKRGAQIQPIEPRLWARIKSGSPDECWPWIAKANTEGYGVISWNRKLWRAHRVVYTLTHGPIPVGYHVCHRCDNPPCCNPAHLFLGTDLDNLGDMAKKGRNNTRKLTDDEVIEIRRRHGPGLSCWRLSKEYGVDQKTVYNVVHRLSFKHIP